MNYPYIALFFVSPKQKREALLLVFVFCNDHTKIQLFFILFAKTTKIVYNKQGKIRHLRHSY